jgi:FixJ family two-component response regulator
MGFAAIQIPMMTNQKLPTGGTATAAPALICVVDDDASVRQALDNLLASADYTPLCFESGEACLACGRLHDMDFAVVDVRLGGMSGFELHERFSAMQLDLPLVFISGHADSAMEELAVRAGAIALLHKPIDVDRLFSLIDQALVRGHAPQ